MLFSKTALFFPTPLSPFLNQGKLTFSLNKRMLRYRSPYQKVYQTQSNNEVTLDHTVLFEVKI